jgi:single-stranded DNA-binding protein
MASCSPFGRLADNSQRLLAKGRQVYVEGRLNTRQYQAKGGSGTRYETGVRTVSRATPSADYYPLL